jgi:type II secretory pathway component PulJ
MGKIKKIKAFTLAELLVAMVITTIVVGMALAVLSLFGKNIQLIQDNYSQSTQLDLLEQQITIDFNRYHQKRFDSKKDILLLKNPLDSISYDFSEWYLVRNLDTLFKGSLQKKLYFNGREVQEGRLDAIKLEFQEDKKPSFLFIFSEKDAQQTMNPYGN